jgi:predicted DCC family thiol-disulfide oxidoreductase YuxK
VSGRFRIGLEWIETRAMNGVCVLCSHGCGFVSKRDRRGYFRFVPLQLANAVSGCVGTAEIPAG